MGDVNEAVREALAALVELAGVETYQEDAHADELKRMQERLARNANDRQALARIFDIEADHAYRRGWNMRTRVLKARLEAIVHLLDTGKPEHASGAV